MNNSAPIYRLTLPSYSPRGIGFAWIAECLRPYEGAGNESRFAMRFPGGGDLASFHLPVGAIVFVHEPVKADDGFISFERYHAFVHADHLQHLTLDEANRILRSRNEARDASWEEVA